MTVDEGTFIKELRKQQKELYSDDSIDNSVNLIKDEISDIETSIENLLKSISLTKDPSTSKILITKLENLSKEKNNLESNLEKYKNMRNSTKNEINNIDIIIESLRNFKTLIDISNTEEKRLLISCMVDTIYWYGDKKIMDVRLWGINQKI